MKLFHAVYCHPNYPIIAEHVSALIAGIGMFAFGGWCVVCVIIHTIEAIIGMGF
jgi:uncharacterized membrane protein